MIIIEELKLHIALKMLLRILQSAQDVVQ